MASGDYCVMIGAPLPPAEDFATLDVREGGSTPKEQVEVFDFDAASDEYLDFECQLLGCYDGNGLQLQIKWSASTATAGEVVWKAAIRRIADDAEDLDDAHVYVYQSITATAASVCGEVDYTTIVFSSAQIDGLAAGEMFILRVMRDADDEEDDMLGDAELHHENLAFVEP